MKIRTAVALALFLSCALALPAIAAPVAPVAPAPPTAKRFEAAAPSAKDKSEKRDCRDSAVADPTLEAALRALSFEGEGGRRPLHDVQIVGLRTLDEKAVWQAIGDKPPAIDSAYAALALRRLAALGVFSALAPVIDVRAAGGPMLTIHVVEHPAVRKVIFEGLGELKPEGMLEALLEAPSQKETHARVPRKLQAWIEDAATTIEKEAKKEEARKAAEEGEGQAVDEAKDDDHDDDEDDDKKSHKATDGTCPDPLPPREWLARAEGEVVFPGIAWKGLDRGLDRVLERLFDKGYQLATLTADLTADGTLTVRVQEGRVTRLEVVGTAPQVEARVRELVQIQPGEPFVRSDLDDAAKRIRKAFPFLRTDSRERNEPRRLHMVEKPAPEGNRRFVSEAKPQTTGGTWYTLDGGVVTLHFKSQAFDQDVDAAEIIRHTPVTGFAPGLEGILRIWDPGDRAHLRLQATGNVNTNKARRALAGPGGVPVLLDEEYRFDWTAGASVIVPALRLAELGVQGYARVDTADRWRINRVDSYLYSLFFNRPDSDYFRRAGFSAFATFHLFERLTAGVEYRRDRYKSLASRVELFSVFNRDEATVPTALITDGTMGSMIFRLEYSSLRAAAHEVGSIRRDPERSIVERQSEKSAWAEVHTVNTLEVASPGLGSDEHMRFVRLVSDSAVFLRTGSDQGLKLRFRAAGKLGDDPLPLQKQESLGGWTALRGYGFKELGQGDFSLLGTAEYRLDAISLFADVGSLHTSPGGFGSAKAGVGLALNLDEGAHLDFAWRADDQARLRPEIRLLFHRTF